MESKQFKFKKLEIEPEGSWVKRNFKSKHMRKTVIAVFIGMAAGLAIFYFTKGKEMELILAGDVIKSVLLGGFFGFWLTNSPCARGRC